MNIFRFTLKKLLDFLYIFLFIQGLTQAQVQNYIGMTAFGGSGIGGNIFVGKTDGTNYRQLYDFTIPGNGFIPQGSFILGSDTNFYGICTNGGAYVYGTIFKMSPSGFYTKLWDLGILDGVNPTGSLIQAADNNFYGTCATGGTENTGTIFMITAKGEFTKLKDMREEIDGKGPKGTLVQHTDNSLYGMCFEGGANYSGTIFKITPSGEYTKLRDLSPQDGINPNGDLVKSLDGNFYGMCSAGGATGNGTIFKMTPEGDFTKIRDLSQADGSKPLGSLTLASDNNLYGMCSEGGAKNFGTIFKLSPSGVFTKIFDWDTLTAGATPVGNLSESSDGNFYGIISSGGIRTKGGVFRASFTGNVTSLVGLAYSRGSLLLFDNFKQRIIGFPATATQALCTPAITLSGVTATSRLPVTFTSSNLSVATVEGNVVTLLSTGVTTLTAFQPGNSLYDPANPVIQVMTVIQNPIIPTITLTSSALGPVCAKTNISFTALGTNTGDMPINTLLRNGVFVASSTGPVFNSSVLGNGDLMSINQISISTGCPITVEDFMTVTISSLPPIMIRASKPVCSGAQVALTASGAKFYTWDNNSEDSINVVSPGIVPHTYYPVTGTGSNGCSDIFITTITVYALPEVSLDLSSFDQICNTVGSVSLTGGKPKGGTYWYSDSIVTLLNITAGGEYFVAYQYTDKNSCRNTIIDTLSINTCLTICERPNAPCYCTNTCPPPFKIYTAITPNGDGDNETWIIDSLPDQSAVSIIDKWGTELYHAENYLQDWNGTRDGKPLSPGVYYYVVERGDDKRRIPGTVSIIR